MGGTAAPVADDEDRRLTEFLLGEHVAMPGKLPHPQRRTDHATSQQARCSTKSSGRHREQAVAVAQNRRWSSE